MPATPPHQPAPDLVLGEDGRLRPPWAAESLALQHYYDHEWGRPVHSEAAALERIVLEGFQAGLSWKTILHKREALRARFAQFDADLLAEFGEGEVATLLQCEDIIRNRRKIESAINNARATIAVREHGGLVDLLEQFKPTTHQRPRSVAATPSQSEESKAMAKALKRHGFSFVGPTTCYALMQAIGLVDDRPVGAAPLVDKS
ncbi:DNA-3-methyladenine glycosylase I [Corynebacterium pelargi]|uniref:DNA-3-methyladenine glycosylase 1 n=1 Tax=Corynebacterium pelargi TaxID=1471400 RepID=A0A410W627_9CORY|nr:DNA-3-methyladenine glycosylase I [Corynebacterium pelargi]QAU51412.1 DNA-3-methyladenine glycosylase 1 [Corynebacterium pelargi]GGG81119.1 3-methyladenine DNA glycosylase [Corynebacterium pelargi]